MCRACVLERKTTKIYFNQVRSKLLNSVRELPLLGSLDRFFHVERWHSVFLAQNLGRWLDRLHIVNHLSNFSVNYAEEKFCIVQRDPLVFAEHVENWRRVTLQNPEKRGVEKRGKKGFYVRKHEKKSFQSNAKRQWLWEEESIVSISFNM